MLVRVTLVGHCYVEIQDRLQEFIEQEYQTTD